MDEEGNYVINMAEGYEKLAAAKRDAYRTNLVNSAAETVSSMQDADYVLKNIYGKNPISGKKDKLLGLLNIDNINDLLKLDYHTASENDIYNAFGDLREDTVKRYNTILSIFKEAYTNIDAEKIYIAFIE